MNKNNDNNKIKRQDIVPFYFKNTSKIYDYKITYSNIVNYSKNIDLKNYPIISFCDMQGRIRTAYINQDEDIDKNSDIVNIKTTNISKESLRSLDVYCDNNNNNDTNYNNCYITGGEDCTIYQINNGKIIYKNNQKNQINKVLYFKENNNHTSYTNKNNNIFLTADNKGEIIVYDNRQNKQVSNFKTNNKKNKNKSINNNIDNNNINNKNNNIHNEITDVKLYGDNYTDTLILSSNLNGILSIFDMRKNLKLVDISDSADDNITSFDILNNTIYLGLEEGVLGSLNIKELGSIQYSLKAFPSSITSVYSLDNNEFLNSSFFDKDYIDSFNYINSNKLLIGCEDGKLRIVDTLFMKVKGVLFDNKYTNLDNKFFSDVYNINAVHNRRNYMNKTNIIDKSSLFNICCISNSCYIKIYDIKNCYNLFEYINNNENDSDCNIDNNNNIEHNKDKLLDTNSIDSNSMNDNNCNNSISDNKSSSSCSLSNNLSNEYNSCDNSSSINSSKEKNKSKKFNHKKHEKMLNSKSYKEKELRKDFFSSL